eukprot:1178316-Prorocentrum_minimum.AAC.3
MIEGILALRIVLTVEFCICRYLPLLLPVLGANRDNGFNTGFRLFVRGMAFLDLEEGKPPEDAFYRCDTRKRDIYT